ncbi:MAG TPA: sulfatase-like hydrolase/transferase [Clostridiaceae bacterium]|nr:sulfatase-like hydrolase/transferase [Clostridiaceae bacterium]
MSKPYILLITADQLRKDALGCYGNRTIETPNLNSLAQTGIKFNKAYTVSPWCLPARASILTGLFPHNNGAYSNFRDCSLDNKIPNIFTELKKTGYSTALVGKCHFAPVPYNITVPDKTLPYDDFKEYYMSLGMDHLDLQDDKQVSVWFYDDYSKELDKAGYLKAYRDAVWDKSKAKVFQFPGPAEWHPDAWVGRKAVEYIEKYDGDNPFFMWVSFSGPHFTFDAPAEYYERVDISKDTGRKVFEGEFDKPGKIHFESFNGGGRIEGCGMAPGKACKNYPEEYWTKLRRSYFANVALIDDEVGKILSAVQNRFGDNALIIFTADHGEMLGNHGLWGKHNCAYEDVWNIPMLVKYPGQQGGYDTNVKVQLTDIFPTCLKAAGVRQIDCDGTDLKENIDEGGYKYVFGEGEGYISVSDGTVKYVRIHKENEQGRNEDFRELTDLSKDPYETGNLVDDPAYSKKLAELQGKVIDLFMKKLLT